MIYETTKKYKLTNPNAGQLIRLMQSFDLLPLTRLDGNAFNNYFMNLVYGS